MNEHASLPPLYSSPGAPSPYPLAFAPAPAPLAYSYSTPYPPRPFRDALLGHLAGGTYRVGILGVKAVLLVGGAVLVGGLAVKAWGRVKAWWRRRQTEDKRVAVRDVAAAGDVVSGVGATPEAARPTRPRPAVAPAPLPPPLARADANGWSSPEPLALLVELATPQTPSLATAARRAKRRARA